MKNETARREIESLDYYLQNHTNDYSEESHTAMMMAIKALEQQQNIHDTCKKCVEFSEFEQQPYEDCISRKAVMEYIKAHIQEIISESGKDLNSHTNTVLRAILMGVEVTPSVQPKTGWIPCSERLPEKNIEVLVTTKWDNITIGEMLSDNDWLIYEGTTYADNDDIKAWMPLPQSYKEDEENEM